MNLNNKNDRWSGGDSPPDLNEALRDIKSKFDSFLKGKRPSSSSNQNSNDNKTSSSGTSLIWLLLVVLAIIWGLMGINLLDEKEKGVILRLGKFHESIGPGFNWNPYLIDSVYREHVTKVQQYSVTGLMLTKDENIVRVPLTVQFNIKSIKDYILNVQGPQRSLHQATDSAIRHVVGSTILDDVLGEGRVHLSDEVKQRLQHYLDNYGTGINIITITIQEAEPPSAVKDAFDDVIAAKEDKDRFKNEAEAYRNGILPESRGKAQRIIEEANAYKGELIAKAEGESERFLNLFSQYKNFPLVTRERLYIDTIQEVLSNSNKVIVDIEQGNNIMYLPLDQLNRSSTMPLMRGQDNSNLKQEIVRDVLNQLRREITNNQKGLR